MGSVDLDSGGISFQKIFSLYGLHHRIARKSLATPIPHKQPNSFVKIELLSCTEGRHRNGDAIQQNQYIGGG